MLVFDVCQPLLESFSWIIPSSVFCCQFLFPPLHSSTGKIPPKSSLTTGLKVSPTHYILDEGRKEFLSDTKVHFKNLMQKCAVEFCLTAGNLFPDELFSSPCLGAWHVADISEQHVISTMPAASPLRGCCGLQPEDRRKTLPAPTIWHCRTLDYAPGGLQCT